MAKQRPLNHGKMESKLKERGFIKRDGEGRCATVEIHRLDQLTIAVAGGKPTRITSLSASPATLKWSNL